ncbi:MAG: T9SS type A sorting domain-containing protein [Bacteroidales bacterium]|jgi:hypothetical protein
MKEYGIIVILLSMTWTELFPQQLSRQVLVPLAGVESYSNLNYSQSVGETAVEIISCPGYIFTEGFQQPGSKIIGETTPKGSGVNVYPNPAEDYLTIELYGDSSRTFVIDFINITGAVMMSGRESFSGQFWVKDPINIESLIRGFYLVRVYSLDHIINRTFKIEKL